MKKKSLVFISLLFVANFVFADSFVDAIHELAVLTACKGVYSMTEAGGGWYDDPHDYYTPQDRAEVFAKMSGDKTRTETFYGVCFDYAQYAFEDVEARTDWYRKQGLYENQFWVAGVHDDYNIIELVSIGTPLDHTGKQNGVYIKTYPSSMRKVTTHNRATHHAWMWLQRTDGIWFWVDPTWTDNAGYVVYGYVENGKEIQCRPDPKFCKNYPNHLNSLPLPPGVDAMIPPSPTANSKDRTKTIKNAMPESLIDSIFSYFTDVDYTSMHNYMGIMASASIPFSWFTGKNVSAGNMAFGIEFPFMLRSTALIVGFEYLQNVKDDSAIRGGIFEYDFSRRLFNNMAWYIGGGVGLMFDSQNKHNKPDKKTGYFAWKVDTGFLFTFSRVITKIELSYDNALGFAMGTGIGLGLKF